MPISASEVKELRERTGAGMMECKKALQEADGNMEVAIEIMRKSGQAKVAKKFGRIATEGLVLVVGNATSMALVEVNCETDFVAKDTNFRNFADAAANCVLNNAVATVEELLQLPLNSNTQIPVAKRLLNTDSDITVQQALEELVLKIGEHIRIRRFERLLATTGSLFSYRHGTRIGVIIEVAGGNEELGKDLAMHVAAINPTCISHHEVPAEAIAKEKEIFTAQAATSGKPPAIIAKMVEGRLQKFFAEVTLLGQPFVKDSGITVAELLRQHKATVVQFRRLEVGEGMEKKKSDFAAEVAAQVQAF